MAKKRVSLSAGKIDRDLDGKILLEKKKSRGKRREKKRGKGKGGPIKDVTLGLSPDAVPCPVCNELCSAKGLEKHVAVCKNLHGITDERRI